MVRATPTHGQRFAQTSVVAADAVGAGAGGPGVGVLRHRGRVGHDWAMALEEAPWRGSNAAGPARGWPSQASHVAPSRRAWRLFMRTPTNGASLQPRASRTAAAGGALPVSVALT